MNYPFNSEFENIFLYCYGPKADLKICYNVY